MIKKQKGDSEKKEAIKEDLLEIVIAPSASVDTTHQTFHNLLQSVHTMLDRKIRIRPPFPGHLL